MELIKYDAFTIGYVICLFLAILCIVAKGIIGIKLNNIRKEQYEIQKRQLDRALLSQRNRHTEFWLAQQYEKYPFLREQQNNIPKFENTPKPPVKK